ncbi:DegT/DnrJ/EryC1/StrS family aminotransferase [Pseudogracilibacillus auburnensis]|uniref:DegT/DnrJ/EryC1/StrS family aminotransferase n=1 Tax=Pseudogracilibacillus auburnensis TaxID=1494959 RepID=UPI001A96BF85|nr:DegT/DnrJ/EryC1/StrS family aminotransferase [Pseudogracilibacillus auburnensis]MBO1003968.1 DegT/DnrJ/EryC1/StrS family aminotransferase [Pseudogracilibacillus auburnensis]
MLAVKGGNPVRTKPWAPEFISSEEFDDLEKEYVLKVLEKKRVFRFYSNKLADSEAARLEKLYRERISSKYALAVNSGTSALVSALVGANIGPGDEVIIPAYTYIATAAAVLIARAVPVIVEVDDTLTMDPQAFEAAINEHTKAVIPVHMKGIPCDMDKILDISTKHDLIVIEDVAQANGGFYKGKPLGSFGHAGCFSFQQYKVITSGEGGLVTTNDDVIYTRASIYHDSALSYWGAKLFENVDSFPGENYRMSEINAALGLAQSQKIDSIVTKLRQIKRTIVDGIKSIPHIQLQRVPDPDGDVSYSLIFYLANTDEAKEFSELLNAEGIPNGTIYNNGIADRHIYVNWDYVLDKRGASDKDNPWNCESYKGNVQYSKDMCPNTLDLLSRSISISLHQNLTEEDCQDAIDAIRKVANHFN